MLAHRLSSTLAAFIVLCACGSNDSVEVPSVEVEYQVYSTALDTLLRTIVDYPPELVVIVDRPQWPIEEGREAQVYRRIRRLLQRPDSLLIERYIELNKAPVAFSDSFYAPFELVVIPPDSLCPSPPIDDPFGFWDCFFDRYPGADGFVEFMRAAFDEDARYALLLTGFSCGMVYADYFFVVLERSDSEWVVREIEWAGGS
jgi:hypothetical protein